MSQGEEFETRPAKRPRLLNPGSDARSSVGSIAPGTVSSSATTLVPGPKAKAKGKAKGKTIAKQWERSVAVHEATQTVEKLFKDMEETLQTAKNDLASARELAFGKDEDPVKLEQFRPYEMVVTRKCAWLAYIEAGIGLEHARAVAVEGGASTEEGPVANWDSVCSLAEIKQSTESAIAQATGPLEISDAVTKAKAETKKFKGTIRDAKASITKLQKASAPIVVKAKSQAAASPLVHQTAKLETSPSVSKGRPRQSPLLLRTQLPPDKEIKRVVVQGGALPEELQELLKGGAPLVVQTRESVDALVQTREFSVCYHAFKRDFELDKEKSGNFAASRKFRMLPFGSAGCRAAADVLDKYMPPWALRLGDSEIEDNCAAKFHVSAKQYMSEQGISLHAMMKTTITLAVSGLDSQASACTLQASALFLSSRLQTWLRCWPRARQLWSSTLQVLRRAWNHTCHHHGNTIRLQVLWHSLSQRKPLSHRAQQQVRVPQCHRRKQQQCNMKQHQVLWHLRISLSRLIPRR